MPQAFDSQRALMIKWFGDIDITGPFNLLRSHGYREVSGMLCVPTAAHTVSEIEGECIDFLCGEWDFGFYPMTANELIRTRNKMRETVDAMKPRGHGYER